MKEVATCKHSKWERGSRKGCKLVSYLASIGMKLYTTWTDYTLDIVM